MTFSLRVGVAACLVVVFTALHVAAQTQASPPSSGAAPPAPTQARPGRGRSAADAPTGVTPPPGYVIGADDLLTLRFWGDTQMSVDVVVRPDGKVSVPLLNDVQAQGLTPEQLSVALEKAATKYIAEPDATVIVREIRSRKVFVIGQVNKQGPVVLNTDMNVLQALAAAGGLLEYAHKDNVVILRRENGRERRFKFNYSDVIKGKNTQQNILLQPNDTVVAN